jgi:type VI secretion system protein ImpM
VLGIWFASIDKAGRHYPFILAALAPDLSALAPGGLWAESAEQAGLAAITQDAPHDQLLQRLDTGEAPLPYPTGWQTAGNPVVRPCQHDFHELFPVSRAPEMLRDRIEPEVPPS